MSDIVSVKEGKKEYIARVGEENDISSPVTVTCKNYTVRFTGNNFQSKHLRRIRRNSVTSLQTGSDAAAKLKTYVHDSQIAAIDRWNGNADSTNSLIFLDLKEFCKMGAQIINALSNNHEPVTWTPFGHSQVLQTRVVVRLDTCLAYSNDGQGQTKAVAGEQKVQGGTGMTLDVVVRQIDGNPKFVEACHYNAQGSDINNKFPSTYLDGVSDKKIVNIARKIVN